MNERRTGEGPTGLAVLCCCCVDVCKQPAVPAGGGGRFLTGEGGVLNFFLIPMASET